MNNKFNFEGLFTFEIANNHQGKLDHGLRIIQEISEVAKKAGVRGAMKLQFRDMDTFIHPDFHQNTENKHIPRFLTTRLPKKDLATLIQEIKKRGMITMVTPFDESSVDLIEELGINIIKIGSCSNQDWPLLEKVVETGKPVICSTGGLTLKEIDKIVSFFQHQGIPFAIMHCVGIYPTPNDKLHLNQIKILRNRYPGITIGFSTHEEPTNLNAIRVAYTNGARIFERHVGIPTEEIKLNAYSSTPAQIETWLAAYKEAVDSCGDGKERSISEQESRDLRSLMRGVYAKKPIKNGEIINRTNVFFAMPLQEGQLTSGEFRKGFREGIQADKNYRSKEIIPATLVPDKLDKRQIICTTIHAIKGMLNNARIHLDHEIVLELSHHYGLDQFHNTGCTIIECINREYAKKLIIQLPGQSHPVHYHVKKDETFQVLDGILEAEIEGKKRILHPGEKIWIPRGVWHGFKTKEGVIFEEVSTTAFGNDSFYIDRTIARLPREKRKTRLLNWGHYEFEIEKKKTK
jgi:sialic acid synthase SpsE/mannose-6-phosphate isomerase-like protein (cupin superfamily)